MRTEVLGAHVASIRSLGTAPGALGPGNPESPRCLQCLVNGRDEAQALAPQIETPPAIDNGSRLQGLAPPTPQPELAPRSWPRADRVVSGVPGDIADGLQLPQRRVVGGDAQERVLAQVPLPLDDLQAHEQVPLLVEKDFVAQEGEVDLPDFLK